MPRQRARFSFAGMSGIIGPEKLPRRRTMFCPKCLFPNPEGADLCVVCGADVIGGRERVSVGGQFLFADASQRKPVALSLDGADALLLTKPTIISRYVHGIGFGNAWISRASSGRGIQAGVELPAFPYRRPGPDLTAVISTARSTGPRTRRASLSSLLTLPRRSGRDGGAVGRAADHQDQVTLDRSRPGPGPCRPEEGSIRADPAQP